MAVDIQRFEAAKAIIYAPGGPAIGTLGEKKLHAVLKEYYCLPGAHKEVKIGAYYADIFDGQHITEIQTRDFNRLRGKLDVLLDDHTVRIVYPLPHTKWLVWLDEESGEATKKRRSPKTGTPFSAFAELYKIKQYLNNPNLSLCIAMLDIAEIRNLNGWSADRKRGSSRYERLPVTLVDEVIIEDRGDWHRLIPAGLPETFTAVDFKSAASIALGHAQTALNVLTHVGAVERIGKRGNAIVYRESGVQK